MQAYDATKSRAPGAQKSSPERVQDMQKNTSATNAADELPGSSASKAIPPTDSPEYKRLQIKYRTKGFIGDLR